MGRNCWGGRRKGYGYPLMGSGRDPHCAFERRCVVGIITVVFWRRVIHSGRRCVFEPECVRRMAGVYLFVFVFVSFLVWRCVALC